VAKAPIHSFFVDPKNVVITPFDTTLFYAASPEFYSLISLLPDVVVPSTAIGHPEEDLQHHTPSKYRNPTPVPLAGSSNATAPARSPNPGSNPPRSGPSGSPSILPISPGPLFQCTKPGCYATFQQKLQLTRHQKRHARPFKCSFPDCVYSKSGFTRQKELNRHQDSIHSSLGHELLCPDVECKRAFPGSGWPRLRRDNFLRHLSGRHPELHRKFVESSDERKSSSLPSPG